MSNEFRRGALLMSKGRGPCCDRAAVASDNLAARLSSFQSHALHSSLGILRVAGVKFASLVWRDLTDARRETGLVFANRRRPIVSYANLGGF
jgi:hypothetical protein